MGSRLGIKDKQPRKKKTLQPFCVHGHEIDAVGRNNGGRCNSCIKISRWLLHGIINKDGTPFTTVDYDREYQIQSGKCKGCDIHQSELSKSLSADHDHKTRIFRMLLCENCNRGIGLLKDNPKILRKLADLI